MAADFFLKLDGIKGESKDDKHKDEIEVSGWSWSQSQTGSGGAGGGSGTGKVSMQDISFTKNLDKSSPKIFISCATGEHLKTADLACRKAGGDQKEYLKIHMEEVMVTSYSTGGSGPEVISENISLNFSKISFEYFEQDDKGAMTSVGKVTYNLKSNKKE